jgi:hypothetical protein
LRNTDGVSGNASEATRPRLSCGRNNSYGAGFELVARRQNAVWTFRFR